MNHPLNGAIVRGIIERGPIYCHVITARGEPVFVHHQETDFDMRSVHIGHS